MGDEKNFNLKMIKVLYENTVAGSEKKKNIANNVRESRASSTFRAMGIFHSFKLKKKILIAIKVFCVIKFFLSS